MDTVLGEYSIICNTMRAIACTELSTPESVLHDNSLGVYYKTQDPFIRMAILKIL